MFCEICVICIGVWKRLFFSMWTLVRHEISNLCLSCQEIIIADAWSSLMIYCDLFWMIHIKFCPLPGYKFTGLSSDWKCSQAEGDIMLFDSLHCKGLLVHMYFLDEKCVLIFKTDNNKMLYLKTVCFEYIFYLVFFQK